ncbi:MAG: TIGR03862 family flavoprotein [Pseudomonadota bacterium]
MIDVAVIGGGPAGLSAAEVAAGAGLSVAVFEAKPSFGRKFLMAGKSGLNLTHVEALDQLLSRYAEAETVLAPAIRAFDNAALVAWAEGLGQEMFTGSSGRIFPRAMKASPLLRAWMARLTDFGVALRPRHRWIGWQENAPVFEGHGPQPARAVVLACGGASWARLGSDGAWADFAHLPIAPFAAANAGIAVHWTEHMAPHFGRAIKGVAWRAGAQRSRGEAVLSARGLEGGGIYSVSRGVREAAPLYVDLMPDQTVDQVAQRLAKPRGKASRANHLRKAVRLDPIKTALLHEWGRPLPLEPIPLARRIKKLRVAHAGLRPMDEAISTAGGVLFDALDDKFMLRARPGVFCAGEMLNWEAPTGGYLLTACFATGRAAGQGVVDYLAAAAR